MTNRERYSNEIKKSNKFYFCDDFIKPVVFKGKSKCGDIGCTQCSMIQMLWLDEEYIEQEVDWSKVKVDTPILVRDSEDQNWRKRHFSKYIDGKVFAWCSGKSSYSANSAKDEKSWEYAKLAEVSNG